MAQNCRKVTLRHVTQYVPTKMSRRFIKPYIKTNPGRLGVVSPAHGQRSRQQSGRITLQSDFIDKPEFLKAARHAEIRKVVVSRSMAVKALSR